VGAISVFLTQVVHGQARGRTAEGLVDDDPAEGIRLMPWMSAMTTVCDSLPVLCLCGVCSRVASTFVRFIDIETSEPTSLLRICAWMCVCTCAGMYIYIYTCIYVYTNIYVYTYVCTYAYVYIYIYVYI